MTDLPTSCDRSYKKAKSKIVPRLMMEFFFHLLLPETEDRRCRVWGGGVVAERKTGKAGHLERMSTPKQQNSRAEAQKREAGGEFPRRGQAHGP